MATILPPAPSASLAPSSTLEPSSSTTYIDAPIGQIGGTLVVGGGGIVKVGGTSVNQQPERRPRVYPQQAPPRLIHISYQVGHDAPTGTLRLSGTLGETFVPGASRLSPTDVRELERRFQLIYPQPDAEPVDEQPYAGLSRVLEPFIGAKP